MNMREAREQLGLTVQEFATLHQCSRFSVHRWEMTGKGHRKPNGSAIALTEVLLELRGLVRPGDSAADVIRTMLSEMQNYQMQSALFQQNPLDLLGLGGIFGF